MPLTGPPATLSASVASVADVLAGTDNAKYVTPLGFVGAVSALRNALAPRGGLAFDGTAASRSATTLTNQNIGTDAFSVSVIAKVPTSAPSGFPDLVALASSYSSGGLGNAFNLGFRNDGSLGAAITGTTSGDYNLATVAGFITAYAGKVVHIVFTRSGTTIAIYVNGVAQTLANSSAGTPPTWAGSITSTYLVAGCAYNNTSYVLTTPVYSYSLYNLALTQADVTEIVELGGAVPERFKFGSQAATYTSNFASGGSAWTEWAGGNTVATINNDGVAGVDDTMRIEKGGAGAFQYSAPTSSVNGKAHRLTFDYYSDSASGIGAFAFGGTGTTSNTITVVAGSWQTNQVLEWVNGPGLALHYFGGSGLLLTGKYLYFKNMVIKRLGAVVHYDADLEGVGYQLHDQSTNKLHALLTTTGLSWSKAATMGYVKVLSDGTTSAQALGGGTILPANCQILRVRARSISGTPSITLGTSSGGSQIVASVALSTTWKDLTIALTGGINSSANSLWMTASAANVVEVQLAYEQLPA